MSKTAQIVPVPQSTRRLRSPEVIRPATPSPFIWMAMFLALIVVAFGAYLTTTGGAGDIELSGLGLHLRTRAGGIALIALGLAFYLRIGKLLKDGA